MGTELKEIGWRMDKIALMRRVLMNRRSVKIGLHMAQTPILRLLLHREGCTQNDLAEWLHVSPASIALSTKRLQRTGMLDKTPDGSDMRRNVLTVTEKGRRALKETEKNFGEIDAQMFRGVDEGERERLLATLDRILANMTADCGDTDLFTLMREMREFKKVLGRTGDA